MFVRRLASLIETGSSAIAKLNDSKIQGHEQITCKVFVPL